MRSMRFWVTAMTRNRRAQNDSRQQSLDFGPVLYAAQVREQQTVTKTLRPPGLERGSHGRRSGRGAHACACRRQHAAAAMAKAV